MLKHARGSFRCWLPAGRSGWLQLGRFPEMGNFSLRFNQIGLDFFVVGAGFAEFLRMAPKFELGHDMPG